MDSIVNGIISILAGVVTHNLRIEINTSCIRIYLMRDSNGVDSDCPVIPIVFNPAEDFCFMTLYELKFDGDSDQISYDEIILICKLMKYLHSNRNSIYQLCQSMCGRNR